MLVYYFVPFIVSNRYLLFWVSNGHNSVTVQNLTHVYMNIFHHKDLGNHLLQLWPKVMKHPVYIVKFLTNSKDWTPSWEKGQDSQEIIHISRTQMFTGICQVPATSSCSEPGKFHPHPPTSPHSLRSFLMSSSHLYLGPPCNLFPLCFLFAYKKCLQTPHFNVWISFSTIWN
jgi:hypothetical protein